MKKDFFLLQKSKMWTELFFLKILEVVLKLEFEEQKLYLIILQLVEFF